MGNKGKITALSIAAVQGDELMEHHYADFAGKLIAKDEEVSSLPAPQV